MLAEQINSDLKESLKAGQTDRLEVLRFLLSKCKNLQIEKRGADLSDDDVFGLIKGLIKKSKESIEMFEKGGRADLVAHEQQQIDTLSTYLPAQLSMDELERVVTEAINTTAAKSLKDMGKVIGEVMAKVGTQVEGKTVSEMVRGKLTA